MERPSIKRKEIKNGELSMNDDWYGLAVVQAKGQEVYTSTIALIAMPHKYVKWVLK